MVAQNGNLRLSMEWIEHLIRFDCQSTHCWYGSGSTFFSKSSIFCKGDFVVDPKEFNPVFVFEVTLKPHLLIKMILGQSCEKGVRAITSNISSADKVCHRSDSASKRKMPRDPGVIDLPC
jgi:hypothetical protein